MKLNQNILKNYINEGDKIIVGVSGGADSMCLLNLVKKYRENCKFDFFAVHINHGIRGEDAFLDAEFVKKTCRHNDIQLIIKTVDSVKYSKENSKTLEQAARELRYKAFDEIIESLGANKLFVAHHKDDQAETILMHILRGSSISGAKGMLSKVNKTVRPLLNFTRKEIEEYNNENKISSVLDLTNKDEKYTRNFIRNKIFPQIEEYYPNVIDSLCSFAEKCLINEEYFDEIIKKEQIKFVDGCIFIPITSLEKHFAIASRVVKKSCEMLNVYADIEEKHILSIINLKDKENGKKISLPHDIVAYRENKGIVLQINKKSQKDTVQFFCEGEINFENFGTIEVKKLNKNEKVEYGKESLYIDADQVPQGVIWRKRKEGDNFKRFASGNKRLSDFFNEIKVSKRLRDLIPILAKDDEVFVVAGKEISDKIKITKQTKNILKITVRQINHKC